MMSEQAGEGLHCIGSGLKFRPSGSCSGKLASSGCPVPSTWSS